MKICSQCQQENPTGANFCYNCGAKLPASATGGTASPSGNIKKPKREAERRQLTNLFCDLVGSTPLSERLDPEEYRQVITDYHQVAEEVIKQNGGYIAQYMGDGLLVYFGYPEGLEDAPKAAVLAGLGILEAVARANPRWEATGRPSIKVRIGIHTGLVVVDDHLALGETVNIAARLEGLAPHNGLVISPQTLSLVQGWFKVKSTGKHTLKGISEPMEIFQVLGESEARTRLDIAKGRGLSPLVGRRQELDQLSRFWEEAKNGEGSLLLLNGEAGIGKSRLVDTIEEIVSREPNALVLEARCSAYHRNSAFYPLIELLEKRILRFDQQEEPESKLEKLERFLSRSGMDDKAVMSLLAEFLSIPSQVFPPLVISPTAKKQRLMESLTQAVLNQSANRPVLLVLEDLHWADASTLEWLNLFIEHLPAHLIFAICSTRPSYRPDWMERPSLRQITLQRLSAEDMADICHHQTRGKVLPKEILNQITRKTEGVPLFVEELTKMIIESDFLVEGADGFELAEKTLSSLSIPSTLQDSLLARLDRLSDAKEIVQTGAVLGREFSFEMLEAILSLNRASMERSLAQLLDAEIFYRRDLGPQSVYQFKHALIQDAAYESLLKSRRQQLHQRVANALEQQFADIAQAQPELLAHHYTAAGRPLQAIPIWLRAGQLASQKNAMFEAVAHLEKGIGLLPHIKKEAERNALELDFQLTLGGAFMVSHGFPHPKVKSAFDRAGEVAKTIEVDHKLALVYLGLFGYYFNREDYPAIEKMLEHVRQLAEDPEMGYGFELIGNHIKGFSAFTGEFELGSEQLQRVIELFDPSFPLPWELMPTGYLEIAAKGWLMFFLQILGHKDQAKDLFDQHLSFAKDHRDSMTLYHIYTFPSLYSLETREWKTAETIMEVYLPIVREFGDPVFKLTADIYYNLARAFQGDRAAFDMAVNLMNVCFDIGFRAFAVTMSSFIAEQYVRIGEYQPALVWIEKILAHVNKTGSHIRTAELLRIKGLALKALGEDAAAVENYFNQALDLSKKQAAKTFELRAASDLARLWQEQGKQKDAYDLLREVCDWFTEGFDPVDLREAKTLLSALDSDNLAKS